MFATPVKVITVSGGGGGLPLMAWDSDNSWYDDAELFYGSVKWVFSDLDTTVSCDGGAYIKAKSEQIIVPDRWYLEMKVVLGLYTEFQSGAYGFIPNTTSLADADHIGTDCWHVHQIFVGTLDVNGYGWDTGTLSPVVYASNGYDDGVNYLLSFDGVNVIESLADGDIIQFAGDRSDGTLWIGINGVYVYWATYNYNAISDEYEIEWSAQGVPASDAAPVFDNLPSSLNAFWANSDDGYGGALDDGVTLLTHTDDIIYSPPTGFSVVSGDAADTYLHVLQTTNPMPISQPTQHGLIGALGL